MNVCSGHNQTSWYAVSTKSRQEKVVVAMLQYMDVANFLPLIVEEHRWSDRRQKITVPLFHGYVFVRIATTAELMLRVLKVPGVVDFVRSRTGPLTIPDGEIDDVRAVLVHGVNCSPHQFLGAGDRVRVVRGALVGLEGTFIRSASQSKLVISVEMIQRSVAVSVAESDVEPVKRVVARQAKSA